jgi:putative ABC transport system permease protein
MMSSFRLALRQLAQAPAFTTIAVLTLAVGIGSATVQFAAVNALLFKPMPLVTAPEDRLMLLSRTEQGQPSADGGLSHPDFLDLQAQATTLAAIWAHHDRTVIVGNSAIPDRLVGTQISTHAFSQLGVSPIRGRDFTAADAEGRDAEVVLISHRFWKTRFGGAEDVVGRTLTLNGQPATIIGVMPEGWRYPHLTEIWSPLRPEPTKVNVRNYYVYAGRVRLRDGVTPAEAQAEIDRIMAAVAQRHPATSSGVSYHLEPLRGEGFRETEHQTLLVSGAVMFVFFIACLNVTNLLLARGVARSKEMAIRRALGASRAHLLRQLFMENLVLGLVGGIGGIVLGLWGNDALVAAIPIQIPFWLNFDFDLRVIGFALALSVLAAFIFGLIPALRASRPAIAADLKEGGRTSNNAGVRANRLRNLLVIVEIALALVLLVGAGLMMRSFLELRSQHPGFEAGGVLTFRTGMPPAMYGENSSIPARFFADLLPRLAQLPGVEAVAAVSTLPGTDGNVSGYLLEDREWAGRDADLPVARHRLATPDYFRTVQIPLLAGRFFDDARDHPEGTRVAIVDEALAVREFGSAKAALGRRIIDRAPEAFIGAEPRMKGPFEIIGVVGSIRHRLDRASADPTIYYSQTQNPSNFLSVVIRTADDPLRLIRDHSARDTVLAVNPAIPIYNPLPLEEVILLGETVWPRRFFGWVFSAFGAAALFLACIGIYGVMSYNVSQRVQELGIRLALGAQPRQVIQLVIRHGFRLVLLGLGLGLAAALLLANLLRGVLYGVSPHDPSTFLLVPLLLATVALLACWLPSRRATLIEPSAALRAG